MLLFCARPRCNYLLRALPPAETAAYAAGHDDALAACLSHLLAGGGADGCTVPEGAELGALQLRRAQLPLVHGGLGLRAAHSQRFAAHWASWADSLPVLRERLPALGADILAALSAGGGGLPCAAQAVRAALTLQPATWQELWGGVAPGQVLGEPGNFPRGKERLHQQGRWWALARARGGPKPTHHERRPKTGPRTPCSVSGPMKEHAWQENSLLACLRSSLERRLERRLMRLASRTSLLCPLGRGPRPSHIH